MHHPCVPQHWQQNTQTSHCAIWWPPLLIWAISTFLPLLFLLQWVLVMWASWILVHLFETKYQMPTISRRGLIWIAAQQCSPWLLVPKQKYLSWKDTEKDSCFLRGSQELQREERGLGTPEACLQWHTSQNQSPPPKRTLSYELINGSVYLSMGEYGTPWSSCLPNSPISEHETFGGHSRANLEYSWIETLI